MVIASGTSQRHIATLATHIAEKLKEKGLGPIPIEGMAQGEWVLVDAGDIVVHLFRPEIRARYNLEKMWGMELPAEARPVVVA